MVDKQEAEVTENKPCTGLCGKALGNSSAAALPLTVPCPLEGRGSAPVRSTWPGWRPCPRTSDLPSSLSEATRRMCSPFTASDAWCGGSCPKLRGLGWSQNSPSPAGEEASGSAVSSYPPAPLHKMVFPSWLNPTRHTFWTLKLHGKSLWKILSLFKKLLFVLMTKVLVIDSVFNLYTN